ncbi:hypothetical protein [Vibrio palustris]|uniref:Uncharacterized protein n=1 Tax=Vibrio palustris TaxID=1918946 RepID=A0A1R4B5X9_9VIBR|nr:hypothetical protein [Vibrio palustris]SJL84325.1 hypothetical protein VPAL9027_02307 [Vibrio palustris]
MKYIATAIAAAALSMSFTASAANTSEVNASDISMKVSSHANEATIQLTESGQPLKNYPVTVKSLRTNHLQTSDDGSLTFHNRSSHSQTMTIVVEGKNGEKLTTQRFIGRQS